MVGPGKPSLPPPGVPQHGQDPPSLDDRALSCLPPNASQKPQWQRPQDNGRCGGAMGSPCCLWAPASRFKGHSQKCRQSEKKAFALGTAGDPLHIPQTWAKPLTQIPGMHRVLGPLPTVLARKGHCPDPGPKHRALACCQNGLGATDLEGRSLLSVHPVL